MFVLDLGQRQKMTKSKSPIAAIAVSRFSFGVLERRWVFKKPLQMCSEAIAVASVEGFLGDCSVEPEDLIGHLGRLHEVCALVVHDSEHQEHSYGCYGPCGVVVGFHIVMNGNIYMGNTSLVKEETTVRRHPQLKIGFLVVHLVRMTSLGPLVIQHSSTGVTEAFLGGA